VPPLVVTLPLSPRLCISDFMVVFLYSIGFVRMSTGRQELSSLILSLCSGDSERRRVGRAVSGVSPRLPALQTCLANPTGQSVAELNRRLPAAAQCVACHRQAIMH
jgi:hypothetical protein